MQNSAFYYKIGGSEPWIGSPATLKKRQLRHISMAITKLENLLKSHENKGLDKIIQRAQNMDSLTSSLQAALPADLGINLLAANVREDGQLVLVCSSPAWASRLRFEADQLVEVARKSGVSVSGCTVKVTR
jgi:hypothetical protein